MSDALVTVAEFRTEFEAELAKLELDVNEINSVVVGDKLVRMRPYADYFKVELQVMDSDVEKAKAILESQKSDPEGDA